MIYFNQHDMKETYDSINNMDTDILLTIYERLLEQDYRQKLEYDKMSSRIK